MSRSEHSRTVPRAMIHRQILDAAESSPDASLAAIAREVSGASPTLVERVLDEYGDPAADTATSDGDGGDDGAGAAVESGTGRNPAGNADTDTNVETGDDFAGNVGAEPTGEDGPETTHAAEAGPAYAVETEATGDPEAETTSEAGDDSDGEDRNECGRGSGVEGGRRQGDDSGDGAEIGDGSEIGDVDEAGTRGQERAEARTQARADSAATGTGRDESDEKSANGTVDPGAADPSTGRDEPVDEPPDGAVDGPGPAEIDGSDAAESDDPDTGSGTDDASAVSSDHPTEDETMDGNATADSTANGTQTNGDSTPSVQSIALSDKQRRTLRVLADDPDATQGDVADRLGVTRPTVSRRLNSIPGFDWNDRRSFVRSVFDDPDLDTAECRDDDENRDDRETVEAHETVSDPEGSTDRAESETADDGSVEAGHGTPNPGSTFDVASTVESVSETPHDAAATGDDGNATDARRELDEGERRLAALEAGDGAVAADDAPERDAVTAFIEVTPEFAYKILRACQESERVTEDEERDLLRSLMRH